MKAMEQVNELDRQIRLLQEHKANLMQEAVALTDISTVGMTKKQLIAHAANLPDMPESLMGVLRDCGFQTGSMVYGNPDTAADSDWCVNVPPHVFTGYAIGAKKADYFDTDQFQPLYATYKGKLLNIICFSDHRLMNAWRDATTVLTDMCAKHAGIRNACTTKWSRVRLFRALCDVFEPVTNRYNPLDQEEAIKYNKCKLCGREAINFTTKAHKDHYLATGVCERHNTPADQLVNNYNDYQG